MPTVPEPILHNLKCVNCKRWLSCGPIKLLPNGGSTCGRCQSFSEGPKDQYRHFAFEALACYFKFPCKNWERNCPEFLPFKKVEEHEANCSYGSTCGTLFSHPSAAFKSKRYLDTRAAIKLEVIPDAVLEYLRCTSCAGYLSCSPILVCRDGTSVCHRCNVQLPHPNSEFVRDLSFEVFVDIMIFPCIYRYRGCTQMFKFGDQMQEHEVDCPYGKPYTKEKRVSKRDSFQTPQKERGVIKTHSGHIYATITPNAPLFAPASSSNKHEKDMFLDEFQRYRENLAGKWGRPTNEEHGDYPSSPNRYSLYTPDDGGHRSSLLGRTDNVYDNTIGHPSLIEELKFKQNLKKNDINGRKEPEGNGAYYEREQGPRRMEYSVYS